MKTISSTEFQRNIGTVIDEVRTKGEAVRIVIHGRPGAVIVDCDEYDRLLAFRRTYKAEREARAGNTERGVTE